MMLPRQPSIETNVGMDKGSAEMTQAATFTFATFSAARLMSGELESGRVRENAPLVFCFEQNESHDALTNLPNVRRDDSQIYHGAIDSPLFADV